MTWLEQLLTRHQAETGSAVATRILAGVAPVRAALHQGHAPRLQAGGRGHAGRGRRRRRRRRGHHGGRPWVSRPASSRPAGSSRPRRPVPVRLRDWKEVYEPFPRRPPPHPGQPVHGLRHPVLQRRLPARQPDPGLERPGLPGPVASRHRTAARHQQLPGVHRPALPGALRGGLRARHQLRSGHHQAGRDVDHRPGLGRGLGDARPAVGADRAGGWR